MHLQLTRVSSPSQPNAGNAERQPALGRFCALAAFCILFSAATIAWQFSPRGYLSNEDSWAPMRAALNLLGTPEQDRLYETLFFARHVKMQYPPTSLLPLEVLDGLGAGSPRVLNGLNAAFVLLNAGFLGLLADMMFAPFRGIRPVSRAAIVALGAASGLAFYPVSRGLQLGQIQVWLDLAFTATCLLVARGRMAAGGAVMGFASLIKPQFLPLLLSAALLRQWRFAAAFALLAGTLGLVSVWRFGWHNHLAYLDVLRFIGRHGEAFYSNNSVNGVVNRWLGNGSDLAWTADGFAPFHPVVFAATSIAAVAFMAVPLLVRPDRNHRPSILLHLCFATLCFVMASPVAWEHHYGILPPMFIVTSCCLASRPPGVQSYARFGILAAAWVFAASQFNGLAGRLSGTVLNVFQATHFIGALLLLLMMASLLRESSTRKPLLFRQPRDRADRVCLAARTSLSDL